MQIVRISLLSLVLLGACKEKKTEPKVEPKTETPAVAPEAPKPTETAPTPPSPTPPPTEAKPAAPVAIKPAGGFNTQAEYEAKANELMNKLFAVFQQAGSNCDKLTEGINKFVDTHKQVLAGAKEFEKANPEAEKQLNAKMKAREQEFAMKLGPAMQACQSHKGLQAAMQKLDD